MVSGIVIIDKPQDWTSHDVVAKLRGVYREKRIGHAGTLDPMATGVLPVFVGRATRAVEFFQGADKQYIAKIRLGVTTDTQDAWGNVLSEKPVCVGMDELIDVLGQFTGHLLQLPPMYSAIKVGGKKLYELARKGVEIERAHREITVYGIELLGELGDNEYEIKIDCSKGTYVRTLCHDIGQALGCGAIMSGLRRTKVGSFELSQAHTLQAVLDDPQACLLPVDSIFSDLRRIEIDEQAEKKLRNGAEFRLGGAPDGRLRVYGMTGEFLAVCEAEKGRIKTIKSFFEVT